jgi:uncharacterized protein
LTAHLACPYLTSLQREVALGTRSRPHGRDAISDLAAAKGVLHEAAFLEQLRAQGHDVVEIEIVDGDFDAASSATEEAMRAGVKVIYQAAFASDGWRGRADFVVQTDGRSDLGPWEYEAWDTKLSRSAKPAAVLQLAYYSQEIGRIQGRLPDGSYVVPGSGLVEMYRPAEFDAFLRRAQHRLRRHVEQPPALYPWPCAHCSRCDFIPVCRRRWDEDDHLTLVAAISRDQVAKLNSAGVQTLAELAQASSTLAVPRQAPPVLERLRDQAGLQLHRRETGELTRQLLPPEPARGFGLLPAPSPGDVFFDMEGDPFFEASGGLEFLFGVLARGQNGDLEYVALRAGDRESERRAFESFIDLVHERLHAYPDMHIYHYAAYEPATLSRLMGGHATREDEVDELLRREVLVDLYQVVRQGLRAGVPSYSLKEIEQFFFARAARVRSGNDAVLSFERYLADGDVSLLTEIEAYNEEDCRATLMLRDWLLKQRRDATNEFGQEIPFRPAPARSQPEPESTLVLTETEELQEALLGGAEEGDMRWLAAMLLDYHQREARPAWWWYFRRLAMTDAELLDDREALAGLERDETEPLPIKRSLEYGFSFPPQEHGFASGDGAADPAQDGTPWTIAALDNATGAIRLRRGKRSRGAKFPTALVPGGPYNTTIQRAALRRFAGSLVAEDDSYPALIRVLGRELPLDGALIQRDDLTDQRALALALNESYLVVQGPPGSGKTYRGARLVTTLLAAGKRVGVAAQSHKVIHNLLNEVERAARQENVHFRGLKQGEQFTSDHIKAGSGTEFLDPDIGLVAGTSWLFARADLDRTLDVLLVDEAGQISLADALAMGTSARSLILLGDPLQLAQVTQGVHPPGSAASVLEHLLADYDTIPEDRGIFLTHTRRMHPDVCEFVSQTFYDGRLEPIPECSTRTTSKGTGVRWLSVNHEGNRVDSDEEADAIAGEINRLLQGTFTDLAGTRRLRERDIIVVAPYNAQVRLLREHLPGGVEIGTVDKFQGRQAAIVFYSMASSSGEDVPRGLEFLLSRNRLNVAISRAQCLAYLVCSPRLLEVDCKTIDHMRLANALCCLVEHASG